MAGFEKNVFINCPFDKDYLPLLRPLLFAVMYLGFTPRIALESLNSGKPRIEKIVRLIEESQYSIHDLSRIQAREAGEYYRLNMPFELGVDIGCQIFKGGKWSNKKCLILEAEKFRYQAAISDLSNSDIASHDNDPVKVSTEVRNWLNNEAGLKASGPADVWNRFNEFNAYNYDVLRDRRFSPEDVENLPVSELIESMKSWVERQRKT